MEIINPIIFVEEPEELQVKENLTDPNTITNGMYRVPVDEWKPIPFTPNVENIYNQDSIFMNTKGYIIVPINYFYTGQVEPVGKGLDAFVMSTKKCYNSTLMRDHLCRYNKI